MSNQKTRARTFPNPPTGTEIKAARDVVTRVASPWEDLDKDPTPPVMEKSWQGDGWHKAEIYFGILIGMQIMKTREEKRES